MTAQEIVEALCDAECTVACDEYDSVVPDGSRYTAIAKRDAIKAALVAVLNHSSPCARCVLEEAGGCIVCASWRKLEEACRGK